MSDQPASGSDVAAAPVVVAVDLTGGSEHALRWALDEARLHRTRVRAVAVWDYPRLPPARRGVSLASFPDADELEFELTESLARVVTEALGDADVERRLVRGADLPSGVSDATLLVMAAPGAGSPFDVVTGAGRRTLLSHVTCPIVLVPDPREA